MLTPVSRYRVSLDPHQLWPHSQEDASRQRDPEGGPLPTPSCFPATGAAGRSAVGRLQSRACTLQSRKYRPGPEPCPLPPSLTMRRLPSLALTCLLLVLP